VYELSIGQEQYPERKSFFSSGTIPYPKPDNLHLLYHLWYWYSDRYGHSFGFAYDYSEFHMYMHGKLCMASKKET
jgi:hypothetical protein